MASSFSNQLLFLLFLMATLDPTSTNLITRKLGGQEVLDRGNPRAHVRIFNHLGGKDGNSTLNVHCKSKDDDLGIHVINSDECFGWNFHPNLQGTTLFFCYLSWMGGQGTYDMYAEKRDYNRCPHYCDWYATKDGVEGYKEEDKFHKTPAVVDIFKWGS
ncbi:hypothetical protein VNO77_41243 [Canavalia gladiata]|uniref:S-protein homolog n=1 Tax=Canavalia gladiata TaxID=3824 RepID=A0AAN9PRR7_CANGL